MELVVLGRLLLHLHRHAAVFSFDMSLSSVLAYERMRRVGECNRNEQAEEAPFQHEPIHFY